MVKGPFSHQSIGRKAMRHGFAANFEDEWWAANMTSDASTVDLVISRIFGDWLGLPSGLRKTADELAVLQMQKVCRTFQLALQDLQSKLPSSLFNIHKVKLEECFMMGTMDSQLKEACDSQQGKLDCSQFTDVKMVLEAQKADVMIKAAEKRAELQKSLESATFMSLFEDLKIDKENVATYIKDLASARANWQLAVATYKRKRRNKGLKSCQEFMKKSIDVDKLECDENLADMSKHFNVFRAAVGSDASSPQNR